MSRFKGQADMFKSGYNRCCPTAIPEVVAHKRAKLSTRTPVFGEQVDHVEIVQGRAMSSNDVGKLSGRKKAARYSEHTGNPAKQVSVSVVGVPLLLPL